MNRFLVSVLKDWPGIPSSPYVFSLPNGELGFTLNFQFSLAIKRAGIPHLRFHDLRHTFASQLVMAGVDIRTVQELLGHKDIQMTMRYAHLHPDHLRSAIETLDGHYLDTGDLVSTCGTLGDRAQLVELAPHSR